MSSSAIKAVISEWLLERKLPYLVERDTGPVDLNKLDDILAVVGPRRSGKTFFMYQLISELLEADVPRDEILFIDFEDYRLTGLTAAEVETIFTSFHQLSGHHPTYLFFDEVHHLPNWSRVLRTLHNQGRYRIVISGSNSQLLTGEISSELRGRYRDFLMLPFSLPELLRLKGVDYNRKTFHIPARGSLIRVFDEYLQSGGFPEVAKRDTELEKRDLLQSYYRTVFYRDLLDRYNIRGKDVLESLMSYCLDTAAELFSISRFAGLLQQQGQPISKKTIANYLGYLRESFFLILNSKFDFSPRRRLMNPKKLYLLDTGFSRLATSFSENRGKYLENIVAIEILRRRCEMFYFRRGGECDFILKEGTRPEQAIQVCWELNPRNRKRELKGLFEAMDILDLERGLILTYDQEGNEQFDGREVSVRPVWKWLLSALT